VIVNTDLASSRRRRHPLTPIPVTRLSGSPMNCDIVGRRCVSRCHSHTLLCMLNTSTWLILVYLL